MQYLHNLLVSNQIIALFLSIVLGYLVGKIKIGTFEFGTTSGTLLVAIFISIIGGHLDPEIKSLFFMLFVFAVGYEGGPQIVHVLKLSNLKHVILTLFMGFVALFTILICARIFHLDGGTASGIMAGAFTHSSLLGTASDTINNLSLPASSIALLQDNLSSSFALTYLFGMIVTIVFCINGLELLYKKNIRFDALDKEAEILALEVKVISQNYSDEVRQPHTVIVVDNIAQHGRTVIEFEQSFGYQIIIYKLKRNGQFVEVEPDLVLEQYDQILLFGNPELLIKYLNGVAHQVSNPGHDWDIQLVTRELVIKHKAFIGMNFQDLAANRVAGKTRGVYLLNTRRNGKIINHGDESYISAKGDVCEVFGFEDEIVKLSASIGHFLSANKKTDFVSLSIGLILGTLIGILKFNLFGLSIEIGGVGVLILGLFFGWLNHKRNSVAYIPPATVQFIKDFGLTTFVAGVGLAAGSKALESFVHNGIEVFFVGLIVSIVPLVLTYLFGRYILKYNNIAVFGAALTGARSSSPAIGLLLERSGNFVPTVFFTITYAVANIVFTLFGPIIIYLVK